VDQLMIVDVKLQLVPFPGEPRTWPLLVTIAASATMFTIALVEGGTWVWLGTFTAFIGIALLPLLQDPWQILCYVVLPALFAGELWTFSVGNGTRIAPTLVIVSACMAVLIYRLLRTADFSLFDVPLTLPFLAYLIGIALSGIPAMNRLHWIRGLLETSLGFGAFLLASHYVKSRDQVHIVLKFVLGVSVATVLFSVLQLWLIDYLRGLLPFLYDSADVDWVNHWADAGRAVGNWAHPSNLGSVINLSAPIALYYYLESEKVQIKYIAMYLILLVGVLLTSTRTPVVAFAAGSGLVIFFLRRRIRRLIAPAMCFLIIGILILPFAFSSLERFDFDDPENVLTIEGRAMARYEAYLLFLQNPWLGVGKFNYQDRVFFADPNAQGATHNVFLEEAAETGLLGVVPFVILLYAAFRHDFSVPKEQTWELRALSCALFAACFAILVECLAENSLLVWQIASLFWVFRGLSVAIRSMPNDQPLVPITY